MLSGIIVAALLAFAAPAQAGPAQDKNATKYADFIFAYNQVLPHLKSGKAAKYRGRLNAMKAKLRAGRNTMDRGSYYSLASNGMSLVREARAAAGK